MRRWRGVGQHGKNADAGIDAGGLAGRVLIDGVSWDKGIHVGDAIRTLMSHWASARRLDLVEIFRGVVSIEDQSSCAGRALWRRRDWAMSAMSRVLLGCGGNWFETRCQHDLSGHSGKVDGWKVDGVA